MQIQDNIVQNCKNFEKQIEESPEASIIIPKSRLMAHKLEDGKESN